MKFAMQAGIIGVVLFLSMAYQAFANNNLQPSPAAITVLESEHSSYVIDDDKEVKIKYEVMYSGNENEQVLELEVYVIGPSGEIVYDSYDDYGDIRLTIRSGNSRVGSLTWLIPKDSDMGDYTITAELTLKRKLVDGRLIHDGITFTIDEKPKLRVIGANWDIKNYMPGSIVEKTIRIENMGGGVLKWEVKQWPEWVEVVSPHSEVTGEGEIRLRVTDLSFDPPEITQGSGGTLVSYESSCCELSGKIKIASNVRDIEIAINASLNSQLADLYTGSANGEIIRMKSVEREYRQGDDAEIELTIENTGEVPVEYRVILQIAHFSEAFSTSIVYDSNANGTDKNVVVEPGGRETVTFVWPIPITARTGDYMMGMWLRYWHDWDVRFYQEVPNLGNGFVLRQAKKEPKLAISTSSVDLGTILKGGTPEASLNVENAGLGRLEWSVWGTPYWIQLITPSSKVSGPGEILIRAKESAPVGALVGDIEITSNAGSATVFIMLNVQGLPTPTPSPVSVPSTPIPTAATTESVATRTAVPATNTPLPVQVMSTPTSMPPTSTPEMTANPTELTITPMVEPTSTPTQVTPAMTAKLTTVPTSIPDTPTPQPLAMASTSVSTNNESQAAPPASDQTSETAPDEPPSGGCNSSLGHPSGVKGLANIAFLLAPMGIVLVLKGLRRKLQTLNRDCRQLPSW